MTKAVHNKLTNNDTGSNVKNCFCFRSILGGFVSLFFFSPSTPPTTSSVNEYRQFSCLLLRSIITRFIIKAFILYHAINKLLQTTSYSKQQVTPNNKLLQATSYSKQQVTPSNKLLQATSYSKQQVTPSNKLLRYSNERFTT